jgi:tetratricopeptide (TPR) repeat protein
MNAPSLLAQGHALHAAGDPAAAIPFYDAALAAAPGTTDALHLRGLAASHLGRDAEARTYLEQLGDLDDAVFQANLGTVLLNLGEAAAALARFRRAGALAPDFAPAAIGAAKALEALGQGEAAAAAFAAILARTPDAIEAIIGAVGLRFAAGDNAGALAAVEAALLRQPEQPALLANQALALVRLRRSDEALLVIERLLALRPDEAEGHWLRAEALRASGRLGEALVAFGRTLARQPEHLQAQIGRAATLLDLNRPVEALAAQTPLLARAPADPALAVNQAIALSRLHRPAEALAFCDRALALEPKNTSALGVRPTLLHDLGRWEEARAAFALAIERLEGQARIQAQANLAYALLEGGDFAAGLALYEARRQLGAPMLGQEFDGPEWTGAEPLAGRRLFIHWEQGLGDVLQFSRYALLAAERAGTVWLSVPRALFGLFRAQGWPVQLLPGQEAPPAFDYRIPLLSLPRAFGTRLESIPAMPGYLRADPARQAGWAARLGPREGPREGPRIGLAWAGSLKHRNDSQRSAPLAALAPLLAHPATWISLQKEIRPADAPLLRTLSGLRQIPEALANFEETAALVAGLDLVITVDTSVAHLAGALGVPCWILLGARADFRWLRGREDSPWYPSVRLFRQPAPGDWPGLAAQVAAALKHLP